MGITTVSLWDNYWNLIPMRWDNPEKCGEMEPLISDLGKSICLFFVFRTQLGWTCK